MNQKIKKHIRILGEKYEYVIEYQARGLKVYNELNDLIVSAWDKRGFNVEYNSENGLKRIQVSNEEFYHIYIELLERRKIYTLKENHGFLLNLDRWLEEEASAEKNLNNLKEDLKENYIESRELGGNRIEVEYYRGLLIIKDDLGCEKSNVIEFDDYINAE